MRSIKKSFVVCLTGVGLLSAVASADPISSCTSNGSSCNVYEDQALTLTFLGISGDVILHAPGGATIDVFRIFNDAVNTGGGTGLGDIAFFYGPTDLPNPSTYSVNSVSINRAGAGPTGFYETDYNGNGTTYRLFTPAPEPTTFALFGLGVLLAGGVWRRARRAR